MRIFLLKRDTPPRPNWRCSSSGERGRSSWRRNLGKARTRSLLINTVLKSNPKLRKIFSRLYQTNIFLKLICFKKKKIWTLQPGWWSRWYFKDYIKSISVKTNIIDIATQVVLIGGSRHSRGKGSLQKWWKYYGIIQNIKKWWKYYGIIWNIIEWYEVLHPTDGLSSKCN